MQTKPICPDCKKELLFCDDSFNHQFGVEIIKYHLCEYCDKTFDLSED